MSIRSLMKRESALPASFDDFFKPWNDWFDGSGVLGRTLTIPAVNISETKNEYNLSFAIPGMKKDDFKIDVNGNLLTVSSEKEETTQEEDRFYTRKEFNFSSFKRSFSLPEEVLKEKIHANYEDGVLHLLLPKKEEARISTHKSIPVK